MINAWWRCRRRCRRRCRCWRWRRCRRRCRRRRRRRCRRWCRRICRGRCCHWRRHRYFGHPLNASCSKSKIHSKSVPFVMNQPKVKSTHDENRLRLPAILLTARSGGLVETTRGRRIILFGEICERKKKGKFLMKHLFRFWTFLYTMKLDRLYAEWTRYLSFHLLFRLITLGLKGEENEILYPP